MLKKKLSEQQKLFQKINKTFKTGYKVSEKFSDGGIQPGVTTLLRSCLCALFFWGHCLLKSPHPLQVFIFDHLELDMTQFVSFQGGGQLSLHKAAVAHDDQIGQFCGQQTNQHMLLLNL